MTLDISQALAYDVEVLPNCFTLTAENLWSDIRSTWEISEFRDDRAQLFVFFNWCRDNKIPMIGFNNVHYDYPIIHYIFTHPQCTPADIFNKNQEIFSSFNRFSHLVYENERFAPQVDLFKINHFDNKAKSTSLKALQINMRSQTVVDSPIEFGKPLTLQQVNEDLIPYNKHDVGETKKFAHHCMEAIKFRISLIPDFGNDVMNYNDTKIGEEILIKRLGPEVCFDYSSGRKQKRQTIRTRIALNDIIFPYIQFQHPELNRVLTYLKSQTLTADDIETISDTGETMIAEGGIVTKGVFKGLTANVGGIELVFGTGGIHGSISSQCIIATDEWLVRDIDVEGLYPNIGIVNRLAPAHLGEAFVTEYAKLPAERKVWQKNKGKKCVEANSLKLAGNGAYGKTNSKFSALFDSQYTMTVTVNGQLMLAMLHEWLCTVPTYQAIQINTDGITYRIHRDYEPQAAAVCKQWQDYTKLKLEDANYSRMWIADVNTYIAESIGGGLKQKGRLWHPDPLNYVKSIAEAQPPAWHKDLSNCASIRAAVAAMVHGIDPETWLRVHTDPFDFMLRAKVDRGSELLLGGQPIQRTSRYYVARNGAALIKRSPPPKGAVIGTYKRKNGLTDGEYNRILASVPAGQWDERIHTGNKSKYEIREMSMQAGWNAALCNDARDFRFDNINYDFYIAEARKLIIT